MNRAISFLWKIVFLVMLTAFVAQASTAFGDGDTTEMTAWALLVFFAAVNRWQSRATASLMKARKEYRESVAKDIAIRNERDFAKCAACMRAYSDSPLTGKGPSREAEENGSALTGNAPNRYEWENL